MTDRTDDVTVLALDIEQASAPVQRSLRSVANRAQTSQSNEIDVTIVGQMRSIVWRLRNKTNNSATDIL